MSEVQQAKLPSTGAPPSILLGMTAVTGMVDAVSFLALGHVFTANMTGRICDRTRRGSLCFRITHGADLFAVGALLGGWVTRKMIPQDSGATLAHALVIETIFFFFSAAVSIGSTAPFEEHN